MRPPAGLQPPEAPQGDPVRVLLLEDDRVSAEIFGAYLRRIPWAGTELSTAGTLAQALALLASGSFDLIVSDLNLPDSKGTATVATLVATLAASGRALVIAITSDEDAGLRQAALASGAYEFLHKRSLNEAALQRLVRLAMMQSRALGSVRESQEKNLRYQHKIARFGQAALACADASALEKDAVQSVLEGLRADAVAYLEPGPDGTMEVRALVGAHGAGWERGMASRASAPVRSGEQQRGLLCAVSRQPGAYAAEELNFIDAAASVLSTGLQRIESEARLAFLAQFDPLTGLPNRALLADRFSQMIVQARRRGSQLGVLFVDLDEFKLVNDTLGHAAGDELLGAAAARLKSAVREGDTVARISGDEFALVLADLARQEDAALVAQKIIDRLAAPFELRGNEAFVTASVGIAVFPGDGE
ncbi:MAG TPA: diguanylate cyclase, partial [Burkholderiales bacterium]